MAIQYVPYRDIDQKKWDACIGSATNGLVYAQSVYLNAMAKHWDALVLDDYEAVMPLTWKRKYGIYYLYQPFYSPQLGVFGRSISKEITESFIKEIPQKFRYIEINMNTGNIFKAEDIHFKTKINYCLDLHRPYDTISAHYNGNLVRNISKANKTGCVYKKNIPINDVLKLATAQLAQHTRMQKDDIARFKNLVILLAQQKKASTSGVYYLNELMASCIFFYYNERAYYILVGNNPKGKKTGASHYLLDQFIRENSEKYSILDFVGSDIPSVGLFYKSFGAISQHYPSFKLNRLPSIIKWLKR